MSDRRMTMYARYRNAAGLTQEKAAELLGCSVRALASWEAGVALPSDDRVVLMVDIYAAPALAVEHLRATSSLGNDILPAVEIVPLPQAVCRLLKEIGDLSARHVGDGLLQIAADGRVDEVETKEYEALLLELEDVVKAALEVKYAEGGPIHG